MLASNADIETLMMAVVLNVAAMVCTAVVAVFPLRRLRLSRSRHRLLYAAMAVFCGIVILANLAALAAPLSFWRLVSAYGAPACVILWMMTRAMVPSNKREAS